MNQFTEIKLSDKMSLVVTTKGHLPKIVEILVKFDFAKTNK
jgi:hypothetical protein